MDEREELEMRLWKVVRGMDEELIYIPDDDEVEIEKGDADE